MSRVGYRLHADGMVAVHGLVQERGPLSSRTRDAAVGSPEVAAAVVSPDRLLRDGVEAILEGTGFSVGPSVSQIKEFAGNLRDGSAPPDVLIWVGALPLDSDDLSAFGAVREMAPDLRVILFAEEGMDPCFLRRLIKIGVDALLPTNLSAEIFVQSIRLVLLGENFMCSEYVHRLLEREPLLDAAPMPDLTPSELEIICFMAAGQSNKSIAEWLNLTEASVKVQIRRLLRKVGAANRTQAAIWAVERGLVRNQFSAGDTA